MNSESPRALCDRLVLAYGQRALAHRMAESPEQAGQIATSKFRAAIETFINRPEGQELRRHLGDITLLVEAETRQIQAAQPISTIERNGTG